MNRLTLIALLSLFITGCEKENFLIGENALNVELLTPITAEALVIPDSGTGWLIQLEQDPEQDMDAHLIPFGSYFPRTESSRLVLGIGQVQFGLNAGEQYPFVLDFGLSGEPFGEEVDEEELMNYFTLGREFPFGTAPGEVQLGVLLRTGHVLYKKSGSHLSMTQVGKVKVVDVSPFLADLPEDLGGLTEYQMITFEYDGNIGIFDPDEAERARGRPFIAEVQGRASGTATLVLAANTY